MFTCSFMGSFAYVPGLESKIRGIVNEISATHADVAFLIHSVNSFMTLCRNVVLEAKQVYTERNIRLVNVVCDIGNVYGNYSCNTAYDEVIAVSPPEHPLKWMSRHSDCIVTNIYDAFREPGFSFLKRFSPSPS